MYLFVDQSNTLYMAERSFNRTQIWLEGQTNVTRTISTDLSTPVGIFVTVNGDIYIDNGAINHRVDKWTLNANSSVIAMNVNDSCFGLFIDTKDFVYCSVGYGHKVMKQLLTDVTNTSITVAGNGIPGSTSYMLDGPRGIFIDSALTMYVADSGNHRIQRFQSGNLNGTTISIGGSHGTFTLSYPTAVILDIDNYLYISEWGNSRILGSGPTGFRCIIGCTNIAELNRPHGIAFDSYGNLFVFDTDNDRLQKFFLSLNSCSEFEIFA